MENYKKNSLTLTSAVALGTAVMIGAGIFALLGQVAELSGAFFPITFLLGTIVTGFSAYSYVQMSHTYPDAGGIGMFFVKAYGKGTITAVASLLMAVTMVINQSLVARTFGTYTLQLFNIDNNTFLVPALGVLLLAFAFIINITNNRIIGSFSFVMSALKIGGIALFAIAGLWVANFSLGITGTSESDPTIVSHIAGIALTILAFKGFTTITNSGSEIVNPHKNIGRAIIISILICAVIYGLVAWAVSSNLSISEIIQARDYALAEAARPAFGSYGVWFTVLIAIIATVSGVIASIFAVSRMLAMLSDMQLIPHKHFGMPGNIQKHTLVYTVVIAITLTVFFDLSRIASMGAILYLVMDIMFHWGVLRHLRKEIKANAYVIGTAIMLDVIVLGGFLWIKINSDLLVVIISLIMFLLIFVGEKYFLTAHPPKHDHSSMHH
ncbi:APC family permease [Alteribacillus bidgolensis]|uniref:Amino acid/polyamine/organocation transporter, APC superfamily n=1 Tax=Alteribacillus bidgolensis TaxID=930129 RepID=A0A1G8R7N5_9BACI|nr:APC family permease [Alteribacillus bidgolensis]SDJ12958.1 amino acid/polyamine/organocation transporter, APC superfamily [Alteribacillus bidgolensis]